MLLVAPDTTARTAVANAHHLRQGDPAAAGDPRRSNYWPSSHWWGLEVLGQDAAQCLRSSWMRVVSAQETADAPSGPVDLFVRVPACRQTIRSAPYLRDGQWLAGDVTGN